MDKRFDFSTAIQSILKAGKAFENFFKVMDVSLLKSFEAFGRLLATSDEELERMARKGRHRRAYYRMMERRKR